MAELNRQLQEYLTQSRGAGGAGGAGSGGVTVPLPQKEEEGGEAVPGSWFGRWSSPWSGGGSGSSSGWWPLPGGSSGLRWAALLAGLSLLCFGLAGLTAPMLLLRGRRFALLWSLGSVLALLAAGALRGPSRLVQALSSAGGALYVAALLGTLYAALGLHSSGLTALGAALQMVALLVSAVQLLPGGGAGLRLLAAAAGRSLTGRTLPI